MSRAVWLAGALAVGLHALVLAGAWSEPTRFLSPPDSQQYLTIAANLRAGRGFSQSIGAPFEPDFLRTPVYPAMLTLIPAGRTPTDLPAQPAGSGGRARIAAMVNLVLGLVTFAAVVWVVARRFGPTPAGLTAWLLATDVTSLTFHALVLTETPFAGLLLLAIVLLTRERPLGGRQAAMAGLCLGAAALCRPIGVLLAPAFLPVFLLRRRWDGRRGVWAAFGICTFAAAAVMSVWVGRNVVTFGEARLASIGGVNLYLHRAAYVEARRTGVPVEAARARLEAEFEQQTRGLTDAGRNRWLETTGLGQIVEHPIDYGVEHLKGVARMAGPERDQVFDLLAFQRHGSLALALRWWGGAHLAVVYVCIMFAVIRRERPLLPWTAVAAFAYIALVGGPEMSARFRMPLMPILTAAAGLALYDDRVARA